MDKKNIDAPKIITISIISLILIIIIGSVIIKEYQELGNNDLYKNEVYMGDVFDDYIDTLNDLTSKDSYYYDNEEISIFEYSSSGDTNGIRYYDGINQKDNDIVNLIPKNFFFTITPNGKYYVGEKYGFFIKTIKDTEENALISGGYNSSEFYKSAVIVFALDIKEPSFVNHNNFGYTDIKIIASGEYHSYRKVCEERKEELPNEIISDIVKNNVVTYHSSLENKDIVIDQYSYKIKLTNDTGSRENNDEFKDYGTEIIGFSNNPYVYYELNSKSSNVMRMSIEYNFSIVDSLWPDETKRPVFTNNIEVKKELTYTMKNEVIEKENLYDLYFYSSLDYLNLKFYGTGERIQIDTLDNEKVLISYIEDGVVKYVNYDKCFNALNGIEYFICVYKNTQSISKIILNIYSEVN